MKKIDMSFDDINAHIKKADLTAFAKGGKYYLSSSRAIQLRPSDIPGKICPIYQVIKPVLEALLNIPFIPTKWKVALKIFMRVLDKICESIR